MSSDDGSFSQEYFGRLGPFAGFLDSSLFTAAGVLYRHDDAVWEIVQAEANRYFAGQISAEECAKAIQSRASIYIAEQCG